VTTELGTETGAVVTAGPTASVAIEHAPSVVGAAPDQPTTTPDPLVGGHRFGWVVRPTLIYLASRVVTYLAMVAALPASNHTLAWEIRRWDSAWFIRAASEGYPAHLPMVNGHVGSSPIAFFPLFPLTMRGLSALTGLPLLASGTAISLFTGLTAMVAVWALVRLYAGERAADRATLLLAVFPGTFVLSMAYAEGLVVTFVALGLYALLKGRWVLAGVCGLLATAASPVALAFVVSALWCAGREIHQRRNWRSLAAPVLASLGFVGYHAWLWQHTGDLMAWRQTELGGWHSYVSLAYPVELVGNFFRDPVAATITTDLLVVGMAATVFGVVIAIRQRLPMPLLVYGITAALISLVSAPVGLRPRFVFLAFPLILAVGVWLHGRALVITASVSAALLFGITLYSVTWYSVFP
jgi:hypothetical protein